MGRLGRHSRPGPFGRKLNRHHRSAAAIQTTRNDPDERGLAWPITPGRSLAAGALSGLGGVLPGLGAAFMAFVVIYSVATGSLNGVEEVWGLGLALLGLVLSFISSRAGKARFYSDPSVSHGDTVEAELAGAEVGAEVGAEGDAVGDAVGGAVGGAGVADESA